MRTVVDEATLIVEEYLVAGLASRKRAASRCGCRDCQRVLAAYEAWLKSCLVPAPDDDPHVAYRAPVYRVPEPTTEIW